MLVPNVQHAPLGLEQQLLPGGVRGRVLFWRTVVFFFSFLIFLIAVPSPPTPASQISAVKESEPDPHRGAWQSAECVDI